MHCLQTGQALALQCLTTCDSTTSISRYWLKSTDSEHYVLPRTCTKFGERGFQFSGPAAWNNFTVQNAQHYWQKYLKDLQCFDGVGWTTRKACGL